VSNPTRNTHKAAYLYSIYRRNFVASERFDLHLLDKITRKPKKSIRVIIIIIIIIIITIIMLMHNNNNNNNAC
jgi:hypothetical protein